MHLFVFSSFELADEWIWYVFVFLRLTFSPCLKRCLSASQQILYIFHFIKCSLAFLYSREGACETVIIMWEAHWLQSVLFPRLSSLSSITFPPSPESTRLFILVDKDQLKMSFLKDKEQIILTLITNVCERLVQLWNVKCNMPYINFLYWMYINKK